MKWEKQGSMWKRVWTDEYPSAWEENKEAGDLKSGQQRTPHVPHTQAQ